MDIVTKIIEIYPLHQISELYIDGEYFCYTLEDVQRPAGYKVNEWTALPRTGWASWYNVGIRYSPAFDKELLSIYNQDDAVTVIAQGVKFKYAMFHGGNDHTNTEGCPLVAYNKAERVATLEYNGKSIQITENIIYRSASNDLFAKVAPVLGRGEEVRLYMLGLNDKLKL